MFRNLAPSQNVWIVICFITLLWILFSDFKTFAIYPNFNVGQRIFATWLYLIVGAFNEAAVDWRGSDDNAVNEATS